MSKSEVKNCPECGGEMEKGYIISSKGIWWSKRKHIFWVPPREKTKEFIVIFGFFNLPNLETHRFACTQPSTSRS
jgi:hypothetical protein